MLSAGDILSLLPSYKLLFCSTLFFYILIDYYFIYIILFHIVCKVLLFVNTSTLFLLRSCIMVKQFKTFLIIYYTTSLINTLVNLLILYNLSIVSLLQEELVPSCFIMSSIFNLPKNILATSAMLKVISGSFVVVVI